jgi:hypothetical protein
MRLAQVDDAAVVEIIRQTTESAAEMLPQILGT